MQLLVLCLITFDKWISVCWNSLVLQVAFFEKAIESMAAGSLRCVAIAYRSYESEKVPTNEEELARWALPEDDLVLLAIVGLKVYISGKKIM